MAKNGVKLSIIVPCYNMEKTVGEQLQALSGQQWDYSWEVIIINNCCTDGSMSIAENFNKQMDNLRIIDAFEKKSVAYARNVGVKASRGESIAFCDADDVVEDDWVAVIGNALETNEFVAGKMEWDQLNDLQPGTLKAKKQTDGLLEFSMAKFLPHAGGGTLGIRKEIHLAIGGFDENLNYLEDTDYCWKAQLHGHKLTFIPEAIIHIRERNNKIGTFKQQMQWAEYNYYLYKKYEGYGLDEIDLIKSYKMLYYLLRSFRSVFDPKLRRSWIIRLAVSMGRIKGSIVYKLTHFRD